MSYHMSSSKLTSLLHSPFNKPGYSWQMNFSFSHSSWTCFDKKKKSSLQKKKKVWASEIDMSGGVAVAFSSRVWIWGKMFDHSFPFFLFFFFFEVEISSCTLNSTPGSVHSAKQAVTTVGRRILVISKENHTMHCHKQTQKMTSPHALNEAHWSSPLNGWAHCECIYIYIYIDR